MMDSEESKDPSANNSKGSSNPAWINTFLIFSVIIFICFSNSLLSACSAITGEIIRFQEKTILPGGALDFTVTGDGLIIIPDKIEGNIKIYEEVDSQLVLRNTIGSQGLGSDQFLAPAICSFDLNEQKLFILDFTKRKIFVLDRVDRCDFKIVGSVFCPRLGYDLKAWDGNLVISGRYIDKDPANQNPDYDLYSVSLENFSDHATTYLEKTKLNFHLHSFRKYGIPRPDSTIDNLKRFKEEIIVKGRKAYFDIHEDFAYLVWEANLVILRIDMKTGRVTSLPKEYKDKNAPHRANYQEPFVSPKLLEVNDKIDDSTIWKLRSQMTYIQGLYVAQDYILVILKNTIFGEKTDKAFYSLKYYKKDGSYIKDLELRGDCGWKFNMDREKGILYSLANKHIIKYQILNH